MKPYLVDVPVLMIFFIRPDTFQQVFDRVREVRPSKLYLCQDGPRPNRPDDIDNIAKCRAIAENIDWECEVHKNYSEINYGCDPNVYRGLKWIFEQEDRMIMLEDDAVPSLSFFPFCKEMFERYENDTRIHMISSFNLAEQWDCPYDYFFSYTGTMSGGWGMWRRSWEQRNETLDIVNDDYAVKLFKSYYKPWYAANCEINSLKRRFGEIKRENKITTFESVVGIGRLFNAQMSIIPARNMLNNIGMTANATHGTSNLKHHPRKVQKIFFMNTYEFTTSIKHPPYVMPDNFYFKEVSSILGFFPVVSLWRKVESRIRRMLFK